MGFFSAVKKFFGGQPKGEDSQSEPQKPENIQSDASDTALSSETAQSVEIQQALVLEAEVPSVQQAEPVAPSETSEPVEITVQSDSGAGTETASSAFEMAEELPVAEEALSSTPMVTSSTDKGADDALLLRLREAEPRLSAWLEIVLEGVEEAGEELWQRLAFLLRALEAPSDEVESFVTDFRSWLERMEYRYLEEFRSELQYRLALALDLEDEEDERNRLFLKISQGLSRTREQLSRGLDALFAGHGELTDAFWEELEELFIMADLGYEPALKLVERLKERARKTRAVNTEEVRSLLMAELEEIFRMPPRISAVNRPEVILLIGVNGAGKTTTIAKLAHRARMQGKTVMIAAADTFRAAAIEQMQVWAERAGALFHARPAGSDPASVAYEAMDRAVRENVDILLVDTAGRLQTKVNLMEELGKIRQVLGKKHPGAPHRSILVLDATTGQNALSQTRLFKEAAGVDELILTKLDGTAKGGVAIAVAMEYNLPITYVGLGEKMEDLRPFNGADYARALLGEK
ncbi:MAG: signal recognition particle-docking protein FtsY [Desulfovibrio sp.]|nr:signal recognition particle-docking protein FtsY [Desulfovibrio sp.]